MAAVHDVDHLECFPQEKIFFTGPFNEISKAPITLKNVTFKNLLFKIKTTEPKKYCVRPNLGIIEPQQITNITVILQPCEDYISSYQGQHKFQILYTPLEDNAPDKTVEDLWQLVNSDLVSYHKLKCFFKMPEEIVCSKEEKDVGENLENAPKLIVNLQRMVDDLKKQNSILSTSAKLTQKRLEIALKPSQFPDLLAYTVFAMLGWLFAKLVL